MEAHIAGIPVEETILGLLPVGAIALGAVVAFVFRVTSSLRAERLFRLRTDR